MSHALIPNFSSIDCRIDSLHGSAPSRPIRSLSFLRSTPISTPTSWSRMRNEGVEVTTVLPKSCISMICFCVFPPEIGITAAPTRIAP